MPVARSRARSHVCAIFGNNSSPVGCYNKTTCFFGAAMRNAIWMVLLILTRVVIADEPAKAPDAQQPQPDRKAAQVTPETAPLLEKVAAAHASFKSLKLEGSASLASQEDNA